MKLGYLTRGLPGLPGHPIHPPLTDATIGIYTFATVAGVLSALSVTGMRVPNLVEEPAHRAVAPVATLEKQAAAGERPERKR